MSLWNHCLDRLRQELPTQQFSMWIRPLSAHEEVEAVTLYAPNRFVLDWVRDKYRDKITQLFAEFCGPEAPQLRLEVVSRDTRPAPSAHSSAEPQRPSAQPAQTQQHRAPVSPAPAMQPDYSTVEHARPADSDTSHYGDSQFQTSQIPEQQNYNAGSEQNVSRPQPSRSPKVIPIPEGMKHKSNINPNYQFDNFVDGK